MTNGKSKGKPVRTRVKSPFADNLKAILAERGLTQRGAAEIAGVHVAVLNEWLQGASPADHVAVMKLCTGLRVDFQWLLTGVHSNPDLSKTSLAELFDIEPDPDFSGLFLLEAKRLKRKGGG